MNSEQFDSVLVKLFASKPRTKLVTVLVEQRDEWLSAAKLCDLAGVSKSGFHRDHKSVLLNSGLAERRDGERPSRNVPKYRFADTEQADHLAEFYSRMQSELGNADDFLLKNVRQFFR